MQKLLTFLALPLLALVLFTSCTAMRGIKPLVPLKLQRGAPQDLYITTDGLLCQNLPKRGIDNGNSILNDVTSAYIEALRATGQFKAVHNIEPEDLPKKGRYVAISFKCPKAKEKFGYGSAFFGVFSLLFIPIERYEYNLKTTIRGYEGGQLFFTREHSETFTSYLGHITNYIFGDSKETAVEKISENIAVAVTNGLSEATKE